MTSNKNSYTHVLFRLTIVFSLITSHSFSQKDNLIVVHKDSLLSVLHQFSFKNYYVENELPPNFFKKKTKAYRVPQGEKVLAYIDASILSNCKYGLVIGTRGFYIHNSRTSSSPGTKYLSYNTIKENDLVRIDQNELRIEKIPIEVYGLGEKEQMKLKELINHIKDLLTDLTPPPKKRN